MATAAFEQKIDIGRTIQRGFETVGRHSLAYAGIALLLAGIPAVLADYYLLDRLADGDLGMFASPLYWASMLITWLSGTLLQATVVRSAILDLSGRPADIAGSLAEAFRLLPSLVGLTILISIITTVGVMLLIVPGIIAYLALIVAVPVLVEERAGIIDSMSRSRDLTRGSRWRIFGLLLLWVLAYYVIAALIGVLATGAGSENAVLQSVIRGIVATLMALFVSSMSASLYVELRTVKEGATTDSLAAIFE